MDMISNGIRKLPKPRSVTVSIFKDKPPRLNIAPVKGKCQSICIQCCIAEILIAYGIPFEG